MENNSKHTTEDWLFKLPENSGFDIPEGYFDEVEDQFSIKLAEESIPNKTGFEIPKNYLNNLEDTILSKVEISKPVKVISLKKKVLKWSAVAASIILAFSITYQLIDNHDPTSEEIFAWLEENIDSISDTELAYQFDNSLDFDESQLLNTTLENNELEYYLDENDTYILIENSNISLDEIN